MQKFKAYVQKMLDFEKDAFNEFRIVHDNYALNPDKFQDEFNIEGEKILTIVRTWENKLCMQSEKAGYGSYTTNLAEKFQEEVRKHFPEIVNVGLKVENKSQEASSPKFRHIPTKYETNIFQIKRIKLS